MGDFTEELTELVKRHVCDFAAPTVPVVIGEHLAQVADALNRSLELHRRGFVGAALVGYLNASRAAFQAAKAADAQWVCRCGRRTYPCERDDQPLCSGCDLYADECRCVAAGLSEE